MKGTAKTSRKLNVSRRVVFPLIVILFSIFCFPREDNFKEMKRLYGEKNFPAVVRIFDGMDHDAKEYTTNRKEILLMTTRSLAETISGKEEIKTISKKIEGIFYNLLISYKETEVNDLHMPEKHKDVMLNSFKKAYWKVFSKLIVKTNIPGVDISINDEYKTTTNISQEPVEVPVWVGPEKQKRFKVSLKYDFDKYKEISPRRVTIKAGKEKHLNFRIKPKPSVSYVDPGKLEPKKNFLLFAVEYYFGWFSEKFYNQSIQFINPNRDMASFEVGLGFSEDHHISGKYAQNINLLKANEEWSEEDIQRSRDYDIRDIAVNYVWTGVHTSGKIHHLVITAGYRHLRIDSADYLGNEVSALYHLFSNGYFYNSRTKRQNMAFVQLGGGYFLGGSKIEFYNNPYSLLSPNFLCVGFFLAGEFGVSINGRLEISFGGSYDRLYSWLGKEEANKYPWLPDDFKDNISLLKIYTRAQLRL